MKEYYLNNFNKIISRQNLHSKNLYSRDVNFRLLHNTRRGILHALNGKSKSSLTVDILGIDIGSCRRWIEYQMTPDMNWRRTEIDHVKSICSFDVSKDEDFKDAFIWKNTQPILKQRPQHKGFKFIFLDYHLQFIQAYQFNKPNERGLIEEIN